jgi:hypothetical protein
MPIQYEAASIQSPAVAVPLAKEDYKGVLVWRSFIKDWYQPRVARLKSTQIVSRASRGSRFYPFVELTLI